MEACEFVEKIMKTPLTDIQKHNIRKMEEAVNNGCVIVMPTRLYRNESIIFATILERMLSGNDRE